ncbi:MAG: hypothetical protein AMXMBFR33_13620 [Candidatus Xenobia bacterium]
MGRLPGKLVGLAFFLGSLLLCQAQNSTIYPRDLAVTLMSQRDVEEEISLGQRFQSVEESAPSLLGPPVVPLSDVPVAEDRPGRSLPPPKQWDVPPFPTLEPALPKDLPPEMLAELQARPTGPQPEVFGKVAPYSYAPSAGLRPRTSRPNNMLRTRGSEAPVPFSLRRYNTESLGFVQVAVYGGTTSIKAEQIYHTLKAAALKREDVFGIGSESFLARLPLPAEPEPAPGQPQAAEQAPPAPQAPPSPSVAFGDITPTGPARPDYLDAGMAASSQAPSFRGVPTRIDQNAPALSQTTEDEGEEEAVTPASGPSVLVLVSYFPDRAAVVELAMDERIGDLQKLLNLARHCQSRLGQVWTELTER